MLNVMGEDIRLEHLREIQNRNLPVYVLGGGVYKDYIVQYLQDNHVANIKGYVVDDMYKKRNDGFITISEYVSKFARCSALVFGIHNYKIVKKKFEDLEKTIPYLYDFRINCVQNKLMRWNKEKIEMWLPKLNDTYAILADNKSRRTMELFLRAAVNGEFSELYEKCYEPIAYFNSVTNNLPVEILVDCGAFDGDDIYDFVQVYTGYEKIIAIEPDEKNLIALRKNIAANEIANVEIVPKGVSNRSGISSFLSSADAASHLSEDGDVYVQVIALDDILYKYRKSNVFIKMDIEGSEIDALIGASKFIRTFKPCLAICVYHKEDDLITIPQYIDSLVESGTYNYFLRFHGNSLSELVFYAVPTSWITVNS